MHGARQIALRHKALERRIVLLFMRRGYNLTVCPPNDQGMQKTHRLGMHGEDLTARLEVLLDSSFPHYLILRLHYTISA